MIHYEGHGVQLHHGDALDVLATLPDASVDSVVTDPPYGLEFMGKDWDAPWAAGSGVGGNNAGFGEFALPDGRTRQARPSYMGGTNPGCLNCGGKKHGTDPTQRKVCTCPEPRFQNVTLPRMRAFQDWCEAWATECLRVLKPGGHLLAFGGSRTYHRLTSGVEDAGFEIRDCITWHFGSGFPKSLDVSKAIDRRPGVARHEEFAADLRAAMAAKGYTNTFDVAEKVLGRRTGAVANWQKYQFPEAKWWPALRDLLDMDDAKWGPVIAEAQREKAEHTSRPGMAASWDTGGGKGWNGSAAVDGVAQTLDAQRWQGWGTALKPATEFIVVARKPLTGTVAATVLEWGTGALNIDACRIGTEDDIGRAAGGGGTFTRSYQAAHGYRPEGEVYAGRPEGIIATPANPAGRWPANVVFDEHQATVLDEMSGELTSGYVPPGTPYKENGGITIGKHAAYTYEGTASYGDTGGASRFFYVAKADASERPRVNGTSHATVKPLALMRWLVRLVTPPGGTVLEPFAGSGTTVEACIVEGFKCIAVEKTDEYLPLVMARIHRRRDPVEAIRLGGGDMGLFDLEELG